jgi:hypothetical protein
MEETSRQIMEMLAVRVVLDNRGKLEEADAYYAKLEPLWARPIEKRKADHKMMAKSKDKMDPDKMKLMAIFDTKIEDIVRNSRSCEILSSHGGTPTRKRRSMSRKDGRQDRDWLRTKLCRNRDRPGRSGAQGFGGKCIRNEGR